MPITITLHLLPSNDVRTIDITKCTEIETIEMNNNLVGSIDMSNATKLVRFRYGSSDDATESEKLSSIDLSNCVSLQHLYLKNQNISSGAFILPVNYEALTEIDMSGNPGAPFPVPEDLYIRLTLKNGVKESEGETPATYYDIPDEAFGEYLAYLSGKGDIPSGTVVLTDGKYRLNTVLAATVTALNVAKTSKVITSLKEAGLKTAETPIASADGLQYFTSLVEFTGTSNNFTTVLPLANLKDLEVLQVNTAGVSALDVSANTKLKTLNCNGSSKYAKLKSINLNDNTQLEILNLKNNEIETIDISMLKKLKEVDLSGNPGADFAIPSDIYNNLTTKKGVKDGGSSKPATYTLPDNAFGEYLSYLVNQNKLPSGLVTFKDGKYVLDTEKAATVTSLNIAKTSKIISTLKEAGLSTANTLLTSLEGLQFFVALKELTGTSNNFTAPLPLTALKDLEVLQINTAGVSSLDLSANTKLKTLNCNGSSKNAKLKTINLSNNTLIETLNLKNNEIETIDISMLKKLTEVDLSGNPGADFAILADIYNNLTSHKGVKSE